MKLFQWLLAFALCFLSFQTKDVSAQDYQPVSRQQRCFFAKPADKPKEIRNVKQEKQTPIFKVNKIDPGTTSLDSTQYARMNQPSLILLQRPLSISLFKLEILSAKHHPPTP